MTRTCACLLSFRVQNVICNMAKLFCVACLGFNLSSNHYSCIDIYAHSCLKPFLIGRKPCSNSETHVQIMKFTCRLNMGFGRRHWSMRRDVMCFAETKWPTLKKLRGFR